MTQQEESRKKLGICNYCNELGPVFEQENEARPIFLVCGRCIGDIFKSFEIEEKRKGIRRKLQWGDSSAG
jgi:hypothetical protein